MIAPPNPPRGAAAGAGSRQLAAALVLAGLTFAAFLQLANAGFLTYDDPQYVTMNREVLGGVRLSGARWALTSFFAANWHPLTWLSHMTDVSLFGVRAGPHHLVSVALHAGAAAMLLLALRGMTGALWPSALAAALFALHPQRTESVAWISERKDVLSVFFATATLLAYVRHARRPSAGSLGVLAATYACGLMAKPMLVTLPFALLLLDWWPLGRLRGAGTALPGARRPGTTAVLLEKLPLVALAAGSSLLTFAAQQRAGAVIPAGLFPPGLRVENAIVSVLRYVDQALWPRELIPFYRHPGSALSAADLAPALALVAGLAALGLATQRRRPWLLTGWLWFLGTLVPVSGLVQVGLQGMADRYSYLPSVGLCVAAVWEGRRHAPRAGRRRAALALLCAALLSVLTLATWRQTSHWKNTVTLFTRVVTVDPKNFSGYNSLGVDQLMSGAPEKAAPLFRQALALWPNYIDGRYNLGLALVRSGRTAEAAENFEAAARLSPQDAEILYNLGQALAKLGRPAEALRRFDAALAHERGEPAIYFARGLARVELGRIAEAAEDFRSVLALDPACAEASANLEKALRILGDAGAGGPPPAAGRAPQAPGPR